jgi:hypothetical protein
MGFSMNSYTEIPEHAGKEIDEYAASEARLDRLGHKVADSGPLEDSFAPSLGKALDARDRARKQCSK